MSEDAVVYLMRTVRDLEKRVTELESCKIFPTPIPNPSMDTWPKINKNACLKCFMTLDNLMCYSCPQQDCPSGLGSITSLGHAYE
jgi:hypothetical protein